MPPSRVRDTVGLPHEDRFAGFHVFDGGEDSLDLVDALHPRTLLAWGMNGRDRRLQIGAPARLRVERPFGGKRMRCPKRLGGTDSFDHGGKQDNIQNSWACDTGS